MSNQIQNPKPQLKIVQGKNNPILRAKAEKIGEITPEIRELAKQMFQKMKEAEGIGLAAPQVEKSIALFVVDELAFQRERDLKEKEKPRRGLSKWEFKKIVQPDVSKGYAFINPSIWAYPKNEDSLREGCLSLPGWDGMVTRSKRITIKAQDIKGRTFKLHAKGLLAKVLQHEYDHLQGVLICDKWKNARRADDKRQTTNDKKLKGIVFFGSSPYSQVVLDKLKGTQFEPFLIIDKPTNYLLLTTNYSLGITAAYGAIIPSHVIKKFQYGILNIHPSLLPKYRGPSPVQQTIINGDAVAGVSIIILSEKVDAGPIVAQERFSIEKPYTSGELSRVLFSLGSDLLLAILPQYLAGNITPIHQDETSATITKLITKNDGLIYWAQSAQIIERKIRAYQPWPICYTFFEHREKKLRVQMLEARVMNDSLPHTVCGSVEKRGGELIIHCGVGSLLIKKLRPEGKREMTGAEFLRGYGNSSKFKAQNAKLQFGI